MPKIQTGAFPSKRCYIITGGVTLIIGIGLLGFGASNPAKVTRDYAKDFTPLGKACTVAGTTTVKSEDQRVSVDCPVGTEYCTGNSIGGDAPPIANPNDCRKETKSESSGKQRNGAPTSNILSTICFQNWCHDQIQTTFSVKDIDGFYKFPVEYKRRKSAWKASIVPPIHTICEGKPRPMDDGNVGIWEGRINETVSCWKGIASDLGEMHECCNYDVEGQPCIAFEDPDICVENRKKNAQFIQTVLYAVGAIFIVGAIINFFWASKSQSRV
jgi:hypothetical protein